MAAERERDFYEVLGVERGADDAAIKRAFRKLAQQWHPDVNTKPEAQERFKEVNEAYQVLSDPQRRQQYDMFGRAGVNGGGQPGFDTAGFGGFSDIFDAFFGGATGGNSRRARPQTGSDLRFVSSRVDDTEEGLCGWLASASDALLNHTILQGVAHRRSNMQRALRLRRMRGPRREAEDEPRGADQLRGP